MEGRSLGLGFLSEEGGSQHAFTSLREPDWDTADTQSSSYIPKAPVRYYL